MRTVGTIKFPNKVIKYFEQDPNRMEIQLDDGSVVNRLKYNYSEKTIDIFKMEEKGSIYKYVVDNNHLFMENWIKNIMEVDCLFNETMFLDGKRFYSCHTGSKVYKLNFNSGRKAVMFTGLSDNDCFPDVVPLAEVQEYFNMLYSKNYRVKEHLQWTHCITQY